MDASSLETVLRRLRAKAETAQRHHSLPTAVFLADKCLTLSHGEPDDVFRLASLFHDAQHFRRALGLLERHGLVRAHLRFRCLAVQCLYACKEWEECLAVLGGTDDDLHAMEGAGDEGDGGINLVAVAYLLRGRVYDAMENKARAKESFIAALRVDVYCYEALEHLTEHHMLTATEETALQKSMPWKEEDAALRVVYGARWRQQEEAASLPSDDPLLAALQENSHVRAAEAEALYNRGEFRRAHAVTSGLLEEDPYHLECLPVHIVSLYELKRKNDLYYVAHKLVDEYPSMAVSWFAVGCYYHLIQKHEEARKFFSKATSVDPRFAPAWVAFGNAFAAQEESDQAMSAYRTASRLFPGSHLPLLYIGMEYSRTNNLVLAEQHFRMARQVSPQDPLVLNEMGIVNYRKHDYQMAVSSFLLALEVCDAEHYNTDVTLPIHFNLGHAYRKLKDFSKSIREYEKAMSICPHDASVHAAIGFTHHLAGNLNEAVESYHKALGLNPDDTFTSNLLSKALEELFGGEPSSHFTPLRALPTSMSDVNNSPLPTF